MDGSTGNNATQNDVGQSGKNMKGLGREAKYNTRIGSNYTVNDAGCDVKT